MLQAFGLRLEGTPLHTCLQSSERAWFLLRPVPGPDPTLLTSTDGLLVQAYTEERRKNRLCAPSLPESGAAWAPLTWAHPEAVSPPTPPSSLLCVAPSL